jgi:hypothetical protein
MFINLYRHDITIFSSNCNKNSLNIKLNVNSICGTECFGTLMFIHFYTYYVLKYF